MFARISAVQQRIGADRFTDASPVINPPRRTKAMTQIEELFIDQSLDGRGVDGSSATGQGLKCKASATIDLPLPVGVLSMT